MNVFPRRASSKPFGEIEARNSLLWQIENPGQS